MMKLTLRQIRRTILLIGLVILVGGGGYWVGSHQIRFGQTGERPVIIERRLPAEKQTVNFSLFWEVWDKLTANYLDKSAIKQSEMVYGAIKGLVASLGDPYTVFLSPEENKEAKDDLNGSFEGVGIQLGYKDGSLAVIAPLSETPAEKAGVKAGDLILRIDERDTTGISLPEAVRLIRGQKSTSVKLMLLHEGEQQPFEVSIVREKITVASVEVKFLDTDKAGKIADLKLTQFGDSTNNEWDKAVAEIVRTCGSAKPFKCDGVILDLRNNPGGYLSGSVFIASEFISSGTVVIQEDASGKKQTYEVNRQGRLIELPLVVLVNQGSASASEIVAGALREKDRSKLVGETTFGKGTVQEAEDLADGSGLHITVSRWLLPSGKSIDKKGLVPDFQLKDDPQTSQDEQLEKAKEVLLK